jgi:hypothetical protein
MNHKKILKIAAGVITAGVQITRLVLSLIFLAIIVALVWAVIAPTP